MAKNGGAHNIIFGDGNVRYYSLYTPSGAAFGSIRNFSTSLDILSFTSGGNVLVGTTTDAGYKLDVNGTGRFSGETLFSTGLVSGTGTGAPYILLQGGAGSDTIGAAAAFRLGDVPNSRYWTMQINASKGLSFWHFNAGWSSVANISPTGAATFSSSVTATQGNFFQTATSGFAINMKNRNANQTWSVVVDTDAVDDKNLGFYSDYGFTPFYALKLDAATGAATFSSSLKTAAPSGGTAKPFRIGAAAAVAPTEQNRTIEIEIDGTTYYLTAKTTND
jgi:hypothetical protein